MNELRLIEGTKKDRDQFVTRLDVLDKVKKLNIIPGVNHLTVNQVANFYEVKSNAIRTVIERHRDELESDGLRKVNQKELLEQVAQDVSVVNTMTFKLLRYEDEEVKISNFGVNIFPKRAVLRIGMLLRDSPVAKEVRTLLLNVYHDAEHGKENIIKNINKEYSQEEELILEKVKAEVNGDYEKVSELNAKLFDLKNKRIKELEPKAEYTEEVLMADNLLTTTQIAKHYGMSARGLNSLLHDLRVQYRQSGQWFLYSKYQDKEYTSTQTFVLQNGQTRMSTKWTEKGRMFIHELLEEEGLVN